jgi:hypothetical protein
MFFAACGGDPCSAASKCSADPKPTEAEIQACRDAYANTSATCYSEQKAFADCIRAKQVCTAGNKTDGLKTLEACQKEGEALEKCLSM